MDPAVWSRTTALVEPALSHMYEQSPTSLWEWLHSVPELAEAGLAARDSTVIWFRLKGGRPVYVFGPHDHARPGADALAGSQRLGAGLRDRIPLRAGLGWPVGAIVSGTLDAGVPELRPTGVTWAHVAGRDRNGDARVDQRDRRRALVMDPFQFEKCYASIEDRFTAAREKIEHREAITAICRGHASPGSLGLVPSEIYAYGRRVKAELDGIPEYRGRVTLLENTDATHAVVESWNTYDVVHIASHGAPDIVGFGEAWAYRDGDRLPRVPGSLIAAVSRAGRFGPTQAYLAALPEYFKSQLGSGLNRTFVFLAACGSMDGPVEQLEVVQHLSGQTSGVLGWIHEVDYDDNAFLGPHFYELLGRGWTVRQALDSMLLRRSEFVQGSPDVAQAYLTADMLKYEGRDLRIFEIVRLVDPGTAVPGMRGEPLQDGALPNGLLLGTLDDEDDDLKVDVEVMAITDEQRSGVDLQLELDGAPIGSSLSLEQAELVEPNRYRVRFDSVPTGRDLKPDVDYVLEVVASLPEGGESRYSAFVRGTVQDFVLIVSGPGLPAPQTFHIPADRLFWNVGTAGSFVTSFGAGGDGIASQDGSHVLETLNGGVAPGSIAGPGSHALGPNQGGDDGWSIIIFPNGCPAGYRGCDRVHVGTVSGTLEITAFSMGKAISRPHADGPTLIAGTFTAVALERDRPHEGRRYRVEAHFRLQEGPSRP